MVDVYSIIFLAVPLLAVIAAWFTGNSVWLLGGVTLFLVGMLIAAWT